MDTDLNDSTRQYVMGTPLANQIRYLPGSGPTILAGSLVDIYYVNFDSKAGNGAATGSVTFIAPVLGVVAYTPRFEFTDSVRVPSAPFAGSYSNRGLEPKDWLQLSADHKTLTFSLAGGTPGDQIRIFATAVPEPAAYLLCGLGLLAVAAFKRRSRTSR